MRAALGLPLEDFDDSSHLEGLVAALFAQRSRSDHRQWLIQVLVAFDDAQANELLTRTLIDFLAAQFEPDRSQSTH